MKVLLATTPSDAHTWNLVYMQLLLEEQGHQVINLGACVPIELLQESVCRNQPDLIVISSINGHGNIEGVDIAKAIRSNEVFCNTGLVIGGKLETQGNDCSSYSEKLIHAGFDDVFSGENAINNFLLFMQKLSEVLVTCVSAVA